MFDEKGSGVGRERGVLGGCRDRLFHDDFMLMMRALGREASGTALERALLPSTASILSEKVALRGSVGVRRSRGKADRNFSAKIDVTNEVGEAVSILSNEVVDTAARLMEPYARKLDGVIVAGGGADFMFETIKKRWPHAVCPQAPRMSVAEGMRRFASMLAIKDTLKED